MLLCAGMEVDGYWGKLCADAQGHPQRDYPTLNLALTISSTLNWGVLTPDAPLRRWRLVEIGAGNALAISPLRLDEQIWHYLLGSQHLDDRLGRLGASEVRGDKLVPSHQQIAEQMTNTWVQASQENRVLPVLQLCGSDTESKRAIATTTCSLLGLKLYAIAATALPREIDQLDLVRCLWEREWRLNRTVLLLDCERLEWREGDRDSAVTQLLEMLQAPPIVTSLERCRLLHRPAIAFEVKQPTPDEQRLFWYGTLEELAPSLNGQIEALVSHFSLSARAIQAVCWQLESQSVGMGESGTEHSQFPMTVSDPFTPSDREADPQISHLLWNACRFQARPRLDELAQRIEATADWEDLVLPPKELSVLQEMAVHVRQRSKVYEQWGTKGQRGLGIGALFAGASGTGKTLAAEVLGAALHLDVYRIDLSAVVSKYIGETEKNLRRVFDAAEGGGVLLFDEADALFGKRTEVKDSHDRHANIEVSYLLQRMEAYRGLAILTTNLKESLDRAFLRRIRFIVQFPFPDANQRSQIWQRVFPQQTPLDNLDFQKLAKLNVAGGNIRNIALNAAFLAADAGEAVGMKYLLQAARREYMKLEQPLMDVEVKGWIS